MNGFQVLILQRFEHLLGEVRGCLAISPEDSSIQFFELSAAVICLFPSEKKEKADGEPSLPYLLTGDRFVKAITYTVGLPSRNMFLDSKQISGVPGVMP